MNRKKLVVIAIAAIAVIATTVMAVAAQAEEGGTAGQGAAAISPDQARQIAEQETGATASSVESEEEGGTLVYEVQVGDKEVEVDGSSGKVLEVEEGDDGSQADDEGSADDGQSESGSDDRSGTEGTE